MSGSRVLALIRAAITSLIQLAIQPSSARHGTAALPAMLEPAGDDVDDTLQHSCTGCTAHSTLLSWAQLIHVIGLHDNDTLQSNNTHETSFQAKYKTQFVFL